MKNLVIIIFIIILGLTVLSEDVAILTTKNGKILENYSVKSEESYGMAYYNLVNDVNEDNIINIFFKQPGVIYNAISELIDLEIKQKYLEDKGITVDATTNVFVDNIDKEKRKKSINEIFNRENELNQLLLDELKKETSLKNYAELHKENIKNKYDVFEVKQYEITKSATINTEFIRSILKNNDFIKKYVVFNQSDLKNFSEFNELNLENVKVYYKEKSLFTIKEIIDPMMFLDYDIKNKINKEYEKYLLEQWQNTYPNNFDFILVYKPLKVEDRLDNILTKNKKLLQELKNFYTEIIFSDENIPELWFLSYYNILDSLEELYKNEYDELNVLYKTLPEEYFSKNYSQLQKITEESTDSTLTSYINNYKNFIYENAEVSSRDDYISYLNEFDNDIKTIKKEKNDILGIVIMKDYNFFYEVIKEKFSDDIDSTYLFFYENFFEYLKMNEINNESGIYEILISKLENMKETQEDLVEKINSLIVSVENHIRKNQDE